MRPRLPTMSTKFRVVDSKGKKYTIEKMTPFSEHVYSIKDNKGHYAEISYADEEWTEKWNNSFVPKFEYDIAELGNLIQEHFDI